MGAAWRGADGEIYAEVSLDEAQRDEAERFAVHPALLDSAGHAAVLAAMETGPDAGGPELRLPFAFIGVSTGRRKGAFQLRLRLRNEGEGTGLAAADADGEPVFAIEGISLRPADAARLGAGQEKASDLYEIEWSPLVPGGAETLAAVEICRPPGPAADAEPTQAARELAGWALERVQGYLAGERGEDDRLAFVTEGGVAAAGAEKPDPAAAAIWGLVRSVQSEHPDRFLLLDSDGTDASEGALATALGQADEPQLAIRDGAILVPRMVPVEAGEDEVSSLHPGGTVLITGGLSGIGALTARHLAASHGVERMVLAGRRGPDTPGASELLAELAELGCAASAVACDVSSREQLEGLLDAIPTEHPLNAVVHCAAGLADGLVQDIGPEQLDATLAPKADAAWHLHELTRGADLSHFVLYSSGASVFGNPGQASYAAANAFLDALACRRRAEGLPAVSIGWGLWEERSELSERVSDENEARMNRSGLVALPTDRGLKLFDLACSGSEAHLLAVPLDRAALRALARAELLPALFSGLVPAGRLRSSVSAGSLAERLASVAEGNRSEVVTGLVCEHVAVVLGHGSASTIDPAANFKDLGFDSLGAVELRNRLTQATGIRLDATLVFDHPTPEAVVALLLEQVEGKRDDGAALEREFERLEAALAELMQRDADKEEADRLASRLRSFNTRAQALIEADGKGSANGSEADADLESASDDELFELIDREVG
jgi:NAD(P)-dependent dehydrogenase (short-subunit alcohol dehydrogenase family)/acyl carrier protein